MKSAPVIAAIDVGTNSIHMVIASVNQKSLLHIINREKEMVRLGSGGGDMKYLEPDAIHRGVSTLDKFVKIARSQRALIRAVATSAVREASNRDEFIERVRERCNIELEVVTGVEEGRLTYLGALHALPIFDQRTLVIDIGGGSTETTIGYRGEALYSQSEKIGSIRMTKRFFETTEPLSEQVKNCRNYIRGEWAPVLARIREIGFEQTVGCAGTIQTIAALAMTARNEIVPDTLNGVSITREEIHASIEALIKAETPALRAELPGMDPKRADIILGGALALEHVVEELSIRKVLVSPYALREGIVFDTAQKRSALREFNHLSYLRYQTIYNLCRIYQTPMVHAEHVKNLALQLFDDLAQTHGFNGEEREYLEAAALLHDVGYHISHDQHHKHSYYIITHCDMPGFTNSEAEIIANIARYHRKSHPKKKHEGFQTLSPANQSIVKILAGILRIAEGIDRRQQQLITGLRAEILDDSISIFLMYDKNAECPDIELWGASRRKLLLEEGLGKPINLFSDAV